MKRNKVGSAEQRVPYPVRIALYSPGMVGLGHFRRNLLIAQTLAASLRPAILLLAEAYEAASFVLPPGADCLAMPALHKMAGGISAPRRLHLALEGVVALRAAVIRAALERFAPHIMIVDHLPRGAVGELDGALDMLRARGETRCVLGLRDILEAPATVRREWARAGSTEAIRRFYDAVWIYGDPAVYNAIREYGFSSEMAEKVRFTGYLDQRRRLNGNVPAPDVLESVDVRDHRIILCLVGGGHDGGRLALTFAQTIFPRDTVGMILTGPFMPPTMQERLAACARQRPDLRVVGFVPEPGFLVQRAERIVGMAGYNTICEILSYGKPALIIPRNGGRAEQMIRAQRLQAVGLVDVLNPAALNPGAIAAWLRARRPSPPVRQHVDLSGLDRVPTFLHELTRPSAPRAALATIP